MKWGDFLSERMVFGLLIIGGYLGALGAITFVRVDPTTQSILSTGMGVLGTAIGAIVAAIWKTDKTDRQVAATAAVLAAKAPDQSGANVTINATPPATVEVGTPAPKADPAILAEGD